MVKGVKSGFFWLFNQIKLIFNFYNQKFHAQNQLKDSSLLFIPFAWRKWINNSSFFNVKWEIIRFLVFIFIINTLLKHTFWRIVRLTSEKNRYKLFYFIERREMCSLLEIFPNETKCLIWWKSLNDEHNVAHLILSKYICPKPSFKP